MNSVIDEPDAEEQVKVGQRVASLRASYGFSQRELARRAGLTNGAISQIEQDQVSPTVASLKKIAAAFGMTLSEFFAPEVAAPRQYFYGHGELREIGTAGVSLRLVAPDDATRSLQVLHERYEPGADTGPEYLSHAGQESGVVIRGRISLTVGGETRILGPGDAYNFPSRLPHRFRNQGAELVELVSAATPPSF